MLQIPLGIKPGPRQQEFLNYLNSALRTRLTGYRGTSGQRADGTSFSSVEGPFVVDGVPVTLCWTVERQLDGVLDSLRVESREAPDTHSGWKTAAYEFAISVLATAIGDHKQEFFQRSVFFYVGSQLDGEYWLPGFRFAPGLPDDPSPFLINAERPVVIDQVVRAIDNSHAYAIAGESSRRHAARLSLLLNMGLYLPNHSMRWILEENDGMPTGLSIRRHIGFTHPALNASAMPKKGDLCNLGSYSGSLAARFRVAGELQSLPREARRILRGIAQADPTVTEAFDNASRLYQVATVCGEAFPSVGLAYRVAAVEAISSAVPGCKGFSDFMRNHITSRSGLDYLLEYMYGAARSGHFHAGSFPLGEFSRRGFFDPLMDMDTTAKDTLHRTCFELTREAIVNWMQGMVPPEDGTTS